MNMKTVFKMLKSLVIAVGVLSFGLAAMVMFSSGVALPVNADEMETAEEAPAQPVEPVKKTEEEWKKELSPEQYRVLREAGTERPFGKIYKKFKEQGSGTYYCGGCNAELFSSKEKFYSQCGWPSFYDPSNAKNVKTHKDFSAGMVRTEVLCAVCDGHLGHVFEGEGFDTPTDQRYCINGVALKFVPDAPEKMADKKEEKPAVEPAKEEKKTAKVEEAKPEAE